MSGIKTFLISRLFRKNTLSFFVFVALLLIGCNKQGSPYNENRTWSIYKADAESSSYSPLTQVNKENVHQLQLAWTFRMNDALENARRGSSECNPIIIDGVMYATSARHRLYAIHASNGQPLWSFDPFNGGEGGGVNRGVTYWEKGDDKRILFTAGDNLFAVNARTGKPVSTFGKEGKVSMNIGLRDDPETISVIPTSPGIVFQDLLIMGAEVSELYGAQPGWIRAYNIINGKLEWTFHTIPLPGEPGYETWPKDAYKYAGGVNDWAGMSLDQKRGMVFLALGSPSYDFYGADRKGKNLYGNCVVALDAKTGKLIWYFQTVHHDLWDYDLPAPPNLVTVEKDGKRIDAVAQTTKSGFLFVFNRETGESLFPIEERKVPPSHVPGEEAWPTQPFPLKPKPYARQFMTKDDLSDFSPASHDSLLKRFNSFRYEGLFTPPDPKGTLMLPGTRGGSSWGGGAFDPATGILYVKSNDSPEIDLLQKIEPEANAATQSVHSQGKTLYTNYCSSCHGKDRNGDEPVYPSLVGLKNRMTKESALNKIKQGGGKMPAFASTIKGQEKAILAFLFEEQPKNLSRKQAELLEIQRNKAAQRAAEENSPKVDTAAIYLNLTAYGYFRDPEGRPGIKPPWGTLNAINLNTGEYAWQIPVGNHPELQEKGAPDTGTEGSAGPIVTAGGLVFISGTRDKKLRAFDKDTGKKLWEIPLPAVANATACTYMSNNKQYIALSVAGDKENPGGYIMAFALP
jgi:quinoprotein glucose dehydrogenase